MTHRVVVVGAGFGGLNAVKSLKRADVEVTLIDRTNHHLFQPLLYQMATGILPAGDIAPPIRGILRRQQNVDVRLGEVVGLDVEAREVTLELLGRRAVVGYDTLVLAAGAQQSYFGHDEFAVEAPGMKSIDDALELRGRIFGAFEMAAHEPDEAERCRLLTFVVIGAGATGVEMAGQIAELSHRSLRRNFRTINPADARVIVLDAAPTILGAFPSKLQDRAEHALKTKLGVEVMLNATVTKVDANGIETSTGERIEATTKIWAAGVQASPLARMAAEATGAELDRAGRVAVGPDCTLPGHPEIFAIGDMMSLDGLPGVAEVAMQQGWYTARTIKKRLAGKTQEKNFRYIDLGSMATISRFRAVAEIGPVKTAGFLGWLIWLFVHLVFLTGFKNRVFVVANWFIAFLGRGRPQRAITAQQVYARQALAAQKAKEQE